MKNRILRSILYIFYIGLALSLFACKEKNELKVAQEGILVDTEPSEELLIKKFINSLIKQEAREAYKQVVLYKEHVLIDTLFEGSVKDERSVKLMAKMVYDDNVKHLSRWEDLLQEDSLQFVRFEKEAEIEKGGPYLIHKGYKLFFKNKNNEVIIYKPFNSVVEQKGGFKIWNVLDTHAKMQE